MSRARHVPIRLCMGCGERAPQAQLLRIVPAADGNRLLLHESDHKGRSGYLHRQLSCWERFAARQGPVRSLRRKVDKATRGALVEQLKRIEH